MTISTATDDSEPESSPLIHNSVGGGAVVVDYRGRPADRYKSGRWRSAFFIIGVEVAERFAFTGISSNLITYLTGSLGQSKAMAAENVNIWSSVASLLPLLGAFIADSYLGRYRTVVIASLLYILGLGLLTLSALLPTVSSLDCRNGAFLSCPPLQFQEILFFFSLYLVAVALGGHKPCVQAFGADQFDGQDSEESKAKSSFFNWWYLGLISGPTAALLFLNYIQDNLNWGLGFGIPCISMVIALVVFLIGTRTYRYAIKRQEKNPFFRIGKVFAKAARNCQASSFLIVVEMEAQETLPDENYQQFRFLDKALLTRVGSEGGGECRISDVNDAKAILGLVPIWVSCLVYAIICAQCSTFFTEQGVTMDRSIWPGFNIPPASLQLFITFSIIFFIPIYEKFFVPVTRALTGKPSGITMLQRIGIGLLMSILAMIIAALVEIKRLQTALEFELVDEPEETVPMSFWWLVPQYILLGIADVFTLVGLQEFFYDQVPNELKSAGLSLYLSIIGIGSFLSSFLICVIEKSTGGEDRDSWFSDNLNRAHLDYFYWLLAGLSTVGLVSFLCSAKSYIYR